MDLFGNSFAFLSHYKSISPSNSQPPRSLANRRRADIPVTAKDDAIEIGECTKKNLQVRRDGHTRSRKWLEWTARTSASGR